MKIHELGILFLVIAMFIGFLYLIMNGPSTTVWTCKHKIASEEVKLPFNFTEARKVTIGAVFVSNKEFERLAKGRNVFCHKMLEESTEFEIDYKEYNLERNLEQGVIKANKTYVYNETIEGEFIYRCFAVDGVTYATEYIVPVNLSVSFLCMSVSL